MLVPYRTLVLAFGAACLITIPLIAQENSHLSPNPQPHIEEQPGNQYTIKTNVDRVIVDVVVNDANGNPVRGLVQNDFSIYENGKPEKIMSFDVHSLDSNPSYFAKLRPMPANTFVNVASEPERGPLYVLLLDLVNIQPDDQIYARQQLLKFIDAKPQGTRFAVFVVSDGLYLVQGFTTDRNQLHATLDTSRPIPHVPRIFLMGCNYGKNDPVKTISVFQAIALYLEGLPGRKNIIWMSGLFPLDLFPHGDDHPNRRPEAILTLDALTRSNSAIYPVNVTGTRVLTSGGFTGGGTVRTGDCARESLSTTYMLQDVIAEMTGGRAFYSRNDLNDVLETATEAGSEYYTLTYSPSNKNFNREQRKIRVELAEKKDRLEYRHTYLATGPQSAILPAIYQPRKGEETANLRPVGDSLSAYMQHGAPIARDVYFQAYIQTVSPVQLATPAQMASLTDQPTYFRERQKKHPNKILARVKLQTYLMEYEIIGQHPNFEVAAGAYDDEGRLLNGDVEEASSTNPEPMDPKAKFTFFRIQQKIEVPESAAWIRLAVRDTLTDQMGTIETHLPLAPGSDQASASNAP